MSDTEKPVSGASHNQHVTNYPRSLVDDPQAVERAAIRMWASDLGGHGIDAGIAWDDATEGERQWYRDIFAVGVRAAEGEQT